VIGSIRRECLDHVIIFGEESLRHTLRSYLRYYHESRLHLSLEKDSPNPREVQSVGNIVAIPQVGGLRHRYERRAARILRPKESRCPLCRRAFHRRASRRSPPATDTETPRRYNPR
jgi:hypothetical protein